MKYLARFGLLACLFPTTTLAVPAPGDFGGFIQVGTPEALGGGVTYRATEQISLLTGVAIHIDIFGRFGIDARVGATYDLTRSNRFRPLLHLTIDRTVTGTAVCASSAPPQCPRYVGTIIELGPGFDWYLGGIALRLEAGARFGRWDDLQREIATSSKYTIEPGLRLGLTF